MAVATYTKSGNKATTPAKLDKNVFEVEVKNHKLLKDAYLSYLSADRTNSAVTKKRGQVSGGGKKPWRQKGTGNARFGSSRNPIWRGGGIAFGPTGNENYTLKLNLSSKKLALRQALSLAANEDRIKIVESFDFAEGKVKPVIALLKKLEATGRILVVVEEKSDLALRATSNIQDVSLVQAPYLNTFHIMNSDTIIMSQKALEVTSSRLGGK